MALFINNVMLRIFGPTNNVLEVPYHLAGMAQGRVPIGREGSFDEVAQAIGAPKCVSGLGTMAILTLRAEVVAYAAGIIDNIVATVITRSGC